MHTILQKKLQAHSRLDDDDIDAISSLSCELRSYKPNEDIVRQGDKPRVCVIVLKGMVARYQTLRGGQRQYISFHITGDLPDAQTLFIEEMDHAVCVMGPADVALVPHSEMIELFSHRPSVGFAVWRETLIDAALFREAVVNNSAREPVARMAHFFCEQYYRARVNKLTHIGECYLPLTQAQLADTLGMSIVTANRNFQKLRKSKAVDWTGGTLSVFDWKKLTEIGEFSPSYLHLKPPRL